MNSKATVKKEDARKTVSAGVKSQLDSLKSFDLGSIGSLITDQPKSAALAHNGQALMVAASKLRRSPTQPRQKVVESTFQSIRASIRERLKAGKQPIKIPLILIPHPTEPDAFEVRDGHTRWEAGEAEGVEYYPYVIDPEFDEFDQYMVNVQREGHSPIETRDWINLRIEAGHSKKDIAERVGYPASWVSKHVKLNDMPPSLAKAHDEDRCNDLEALYLLTTQFEKFPDEIDQFVNAAETITQQSARAFIKSIQPEVKTPPAPVVAVGGNGTLSGNGGLDSTGGGSGGGSSAEGTGPKTDGDPAWPFPIPGTKDGQEGANGSGGTTPPAGEKESSGGGSGASAEGNQPQGKPASAPKAKRPVIRIKFQEQDAVLLTDKIAESGAAWIKLADGSEVQLPSNSQITFIGAEAV